MIQAIGQQGSSPGWLSQHGVQIQQGQIITDGEGRTSSTVIYAGGDCVHGPDLISTAAAAGRRAALAVYDDFKSGHRRNKKSAFDQQSSSSFMSQAAP